MAQKTFTVFGWESGEAYDQGKAPDHYVLVTATDEEQAENEGDRLLTRRYGKQEVVSC